MKKQEFAGKVGQRKQFNLNKQNGFFSLKKSEGCTIFYADNYKWVPFKQDEAVSAPTGHEGIMSIIPNELGENRAKNENGSVELP